MAKKIKIRNEDPKINFRLPEKLKLEIHKQASLVNKTVSNYLRDHLTKYLDGTLYQKEIDFLEDHQFVNSTEFLQLVTWMYRKRKDNYFRSDNEQLDKYIYTIKNIQHHLPIDLIQEFDKVLVCLLNVPSGNRILKFTGENIIREAFNYGKLEEFIERLNQPYELK